MTRPNDLGKLALKGIELRAYGRDPVGLERFEHELNLGTADVRGRKVKAGHGCFQVERWKSEQSSGAKVQRSFQKTPRFE